MFNVMNVSIDEVIDGVGIGYTKLDTVDFLNLAHYPNWSIDQRYFERINKERGKHLCGVFGPSMRQVAIGVLNNIPYILNGNSRKQAIIGGKLKNAPTKMYAEVYFCNTPKDLDNLFETFDSRYAVDSSKDLQSYALEASAVSFKSPALKSNFWAALCASKNAGSTGGTKTLSAMVASITKSKTALNILDSMDFDPKTHGKRVCSAPVFSVLLHILDKYGYKGAEYVDGFKKRDNRFDSIYAVLDGKDDNGLSIPLSETNAMRRKYFANWVAIFEAEIN